MMAAKTVASFVNPVDKFTFVIRLAQFGLLTENRRCFGAETLRHRQGVLAPVDFGLPRNRACSSSGPFRIRIVFAMCPPNPSQWPWDN